MSAIQEASRASSRLSEALTTLWKGSDAEEESAAHDRAGVCGGPRRHAAFARKDLVGGAANETTSRWFVELGSAPASDGTSKAQLKAERDRFEADAAADGIQMTERYAFDDLLNAVSVSATPSDAARMRALPGVKGVFPVHTMTLRPRRRAPARRSTSPTRWG